MMRRVSAFLFLCLLALQVHAAPDKQPVLDLLNSLRQAYASVNSFTVNMQLERFAPDYALQRQQVWFKRPQLIKLKQLGPFKKGAELVIKPGEEGIHGHLGGFLSFMVVELEADDENLLGVTNDTAFNTDFDKIIDIAFELVDKMKDYRISEEQTARGKKIVLDTFYDAKISQYRMYINADTRMIAGLERYANGKLLHKIMWQDLMLNPSISNQEFEL